MLSDEEKKAMKEVKHFKELTRYWQEEEYEEKEIAGYIETILNLIEKQSKEIQLLKEQKQYVIDEYGETIEKQSKEIEELNLENIELKQSKIVDKNSIPNQDNFYDCYNFVSKDKIKAKIEEVKDGTYDAKIVLQSLLEKE